MIKSWWVLLFLFCCLIWSERSIHHHRLEYNKLTSQHTGLLNDKEQALQFQKTLLEKLNSKNDPAWIELTLMHRLGLVPEGQTKVFFTARSKEYED